MTATILQLMTPAAQERYWNKVEPTGFCWHWTGAQHKRSKHGVFGIWIGNGRTKVFYTHRIAYELLIGPIPEGLVLDHLCRVRFCVNPDHTEPITAAENNARGFSPSAIVARLNVCGRGHEYTPENTRRNKRGNRQCITCEQLRYLKQKAVA